MSGTLYVSVKETFQPTMTLAEVARCAVGNWRITPTKALKCNRVCAVVSGASIGAWLLIGAAYSDEVDGQGERRTMLSLGEALPLRPQDYDVPSMRRGVVTVID